VRAVTQSHRLRCVEEDGETAGFKVAFFPRLTLRHIAKKQWLSVTAHGHAAITIYVVSTFSVVLSVSSVKLCVTFPFVILSVLVS
jgi:hypothetical protein